MSGRPQPNSVRSRLRDFVRDFHQRHGRMPARSELPATMAIGYAESSIISGLTNARKDLGLASRTKMTSPAAGPVTNKNVISADTIAAEVARLIAYHEGELEKLRAIGSKP